MSDIERRHTCTNICFARFLCHLITLVSANIAFDHMIRAQICETMILGVRESVRYGKLPVEQFILSPALRLANKLYHLCLYELLKRGLFQIFTDEQGAFDFLWRNIT